MITDIDGDRAVLDGCMIRRPDTVSEHDWLYAWSLVAYYQALAR